jgi:hypothetical protein
MAQSGWWGASRSAWARASGRLQGGNRLGVAAGRATFGLAKLVSRMFSAGGNSGKWREIGGSRRNSLGSESSHEYSYTCVNPTQPVFRVEGSLGSSFGQEYFRSRQYLIFRRSWLSVADDWLMVDTSMSAVSIRDSPKVPFRGNAQSRWHPA